MDAWTAERAALLARIDQLETALTRAREDLADETARAVLAEQERDDLAAVLADARPYTLAEANHG